MLEQILRGITNQQEVVKERFGLNRIPPEHLDYVINIGTGDGVWSVLAEAYAHPLNQLLLAPAPPTVNAVKEYWTEGMLSEEEFVFIASQLIAPQVVSCRKIKGYTLPDLITMTAASPACTVIRTVNVSMKTLLAQLPRIEPIRALIIMGIRTSSNGTDKEIEQLKQLFTTVDDCSQKELLHLIAQNPPEPKEIPDELEISKETAGTV